MKVIVWIVRTFVKIFFRIELHDMDRIPSEGRVIICPNHKSNWDSVFLYFFSPRHIHFLAKKELFNNKLLAKILYSQDVIPVDREKPSLATIRKCIEVLENDEVLGIFPQGTRLEELRESDVKSGVALIAFKANSNVLPVKIVSTYRIFSKVDIYFGEELEPKLDESLSQKENYDAWSREIIRHIKELG